MEYSQRAANWLKDAENHIAERIIGKIEDIQDYPEHYLKRLSNSPHYRLRVGDYRVIIDWQKDEDIMFIREIGKRDNVYSR